MSMQYHTPRRSSVDTMDIVEAFTDAAMQMASPSKRPSQSKEPVATKKVKGVRTATFFTHGQDNIYTGGLTFRPNKRYSKSQYDKKNCTHGTVGDKDYLQIGSQIAQTTIRALAAKSDYNYWWSMKSQIPQRRVNVTNNDIHIAGAYQKKFEVVWQKAETMIVNKNLHIVTLDLYDLICKVTCASPNKNAFITVNGVKYPWNHPLSLIQESAARSGQRSVAAGITDPWKNISNIQDIEYTIDKAYKLREIWGIAKHTKITLTPGDTYRHVQFHRKNFVFDEQKLIDQGLGEENAELSLIKEGYIKGVSTMLLVRARGGVVHNNDGTPTIDGANLDTVTVYTNYVREVMPFMDYFTFDMGGNWTGEGGPRSDYKQTQEEDPKTVPGE